MSAILLTTINARYSHTAFGLRWLYANLGPLQPQAAIREFFLRQKPEDIVADILAEEPFIMGIGVYIWNVEIVTEVVRLLRAKRPDLIIVLGGPEVRFEYEDMPVLAWADYLIRGEGEAAFRELCGELLAGKRPPEKIVTADPAPLAALTLPYDAYTDDDIAHRLIYVETSRGCPFRCAFCLSALDCGVRTLPLEPFFTAMDTLIDRGAKLFKFVDRTANINPDRMTEVLDFFQTRWRDGMQLHFEVLPDRLPPSLLDRIAQFPEGGLHLEVGVQSFSAAALDAIDRPQDLADTEGALWFLRKRTGALLHVDLVAGLPNETWDTFEAGFNRLWTIRPHAIQVGILKRLKGAPIIAFERTGRLTFDPNPPYAIVETDTLSREAIVRIKQFARLFDLYHNSGNFPRMLPLLLDPAPSPFAEFMAFSDAFWDAFGQGHGIALIEQARFLYDYLRIYAPVSLETLAHAIKADYYRIPGRRERLDFLVL